MERSADNVIQSEVEDKQADKNPYQSIVIISVRRILSVSASHNYLFDIQRYNFSSYGKGYNWKPRIVSYQTLAKWLSWTITTPYAAI
jgi:hypothetical protein